MTGVYIKITFFPKKPSTNLDLPHMLYQMFGHHCSNVKSNATKID